MIDTAESPQWNDVRQAAENLLGEDIAARIQEARRAANPSGELISILHKVQGRFGYLSCENMDAVAQLLQVPTSVVSGVATFYHFFLLEKPGRYSIGVCMGTACYVRGADKVLARLKDELGIDVGESTKDGMFSLTQCRCLGTCGLAPVMTVNDEVHERVTPDTIPGLLEKLAKTAKTDSH